MRGAAKTSRLGPLQRVRAGVLLIASVTLWAACARTPELTMACSSAFPWTAANAFSEGVTLIQPDAQQSDVRLSLNVPAFRLDVLVADTIVRSYQVAVGSRKYPTPRGAFEISEVVWDPWWIPPPSDWARDDKPTPPGPGNPLGKVKLQFRPYYFLHGTPDTSSLGRPVSHGCVRMANTSVVELARMLESGMDALSAAPVDLRPAARSRTVRLSRAVPLEVRYDLVEVRDSLVLVHADIYRARREPLTDLIFAELGRQGISPAAVDSGAVQRFASGRFRSAPVSQLVRRQ